MFIVGPFAPIFIPIIIGLIFFIAASKKNVDLHNSTHQLV